MQKIDKILLDQVQNVLMGVQKFRMHLLKFIFTKMDQREGPDQDVGAELEAIKTLF